MANIVTLANTVTVKGTKGAGVWQAVEEAADISAFDRLDLQITFLAQAGSGGSTPDGCSVKLYTSMQNTSDIDDAWGGLANPLVSASFAVESPVAWKNVIVKADTAALLRYLRWYIAFSSETAQVTFSIQGGCGSSSSRSGRASPAPTDAHAGRGGACPALPAAKKSHTHLGSSGGRLVCRDVRFDARSRAGACVRVALGVDAPPASPIELPHEFSRCGFRGAIDAELVVFASGLPVATKVMTEFVAPASRPAVDLNGCVFTVRRAWAVTQENRPSLLLRVGARLLGPEGASTRFFNCVFAGEADAMIFASAQEVVTTGCRFANESFPESSRRLSPDGPAWRTLHAARLEGGVDIVLEGMPVEDEQEVRVTGDGLAPLGWRGAGLSDVARAYVGPLASLTAQDCRSTSPQFLFARRAPTDRHVGRDSTVIGLHHAFDSAPIPDPLQLPPPILWMAREGVPSGPSLQLIGCRIDGDDRRRAPMVFAPDGGNDQPTVFDYGTSSDREQLATPVGHGVERYPGTFAPTAVGYVPFRR